MSAHDGEKKAKLLCGKTLAAVVTSQVAKEVARVIEVSNGQVVPTLAVVQVGNDPASSVFIRVKQRAATEAGMRFVLKHFEGSITSADLIAAIEALNRDP